MKPFQWKAPAKATAIVAIAISAPFAVQAVFGSAWGFALFMCYPVAAFIALVYLVLTA